METINDLMNFLNQMEVFKTLTGIEYNTFKIIKKIQQRNLRLLM